jgi:iron complex transport system substrate-binding protein
MIQTLSSLVGAAHKGAQLILELEAGLASVRRAASAFPRKPKVYFEEWDEPMISGIRWVSELVEIAGGEDIFSERSYSQSASGRIIGDAREVVDQKPDVILGSWCGKKFRPEKVAARPGWDAIPAVRDNQLHEIKSAEILQPGPAALTDGVRRIHAILAGYLKASSRPSPRTQRRGA